MVVVQLVLVRCQEDESRAEKRARTDKLALGTSCDSCDSSDSSDEDSNRGDGRCEMML